MINAGQYKKQKAAGTLELRRYGQSFMALCACYDPQTGAQLMPQAIVFDKSQVEKTLAAAQSDVDGLTQLLADMSALPE